MSSPRAFSALGLNRRLRLTRVRVISQIVFFALFLLAVWATGRRSQPPR
jgi:hypothetical protein